MLIFHLKKPYQEVANYQCPYPLAAEEVQTLADEDGGLGQQHLHAWGAGQAVEPVQGILQKQLTV